VAAWDELEGKVADFSSRGPTSGDGYVKPDVAAPGVRINSALVGFLDGLTDPSQPHYGAISGTSMSTPGVAGLVTCMAQLYKEKVGVELTVDEVKRMMAELGPNQPKDSNVGWGLIHWSLVEQWVSTQYGVTL
jgi:subtilisin family serine protease